MSEFVVNAEKRDDKGKGASRRLRREAGNIPAILFGGNQEPQPLTLVHKDLMKQLESESFFSSILTINVDGSEEKAILKDLQRHPAKNVVLHADFQRVVPGEKVKMTIPLHFINQDKCAAIKLGAKASHTMNQVKVISTPEALPEFLAVDMQNVQEGQIVHLSDIILPEGVQIEALRLGADHDQAVANIAAKKGA
ncbi:MAG: 50S ribosomal protein L25/general stress protein Ctc [Motiliproteus sp.]|nr:50S ribosomal protein L25/general stress protein Ctc [Motiliproteus sp.]